MVRGLVHEQAARVALVPVPAPEVVGPVAGVQHPLEVHAGHRADGPVAHELAHLRAVGRVAVVERDAQLPARARDGVEDLLALHLVHGHRLLADDVAAQLHGAHDVAVVRAVDRGDDHRVGLRRPNHLVEALGREGRHGRRAVPGDGAVGERHARGIHVAERDQLARLAVRPRDRLVEERGPAPGAHLRVPLPCCHADGPPRARVWEPPRACQWIKRDLARATRAP